MSWNCWSGPALRRSKRSAAGTGVTVRHFGLTDRGRIAPGL
ncbi:hypothetical protein [Streptomyces sp. PA5.6]